MRSIVDDEKRKKYDRRSYIKRTYGITRSAYLQQLEEQNGLCKFCKKHPATHIDHNHDTGKIRGILCNPCNVALGTFEVLVKTFGLPNVINYLAEDIDIGAGPIFDNPGGTYRNSSYFARLTTSAVCTEDSDTTEQNLT